MYYRLPHAHILIILKNKDKVRSTNDIDKIISAEIPDPVKCPILHEIVTSQHLHGKLKFEYMKSVNDSLYKGPCGDLNPGSPCMVDGHCRFNFPFAYQEITTEKDEGGYPDYKRSKPSDTTGTFTKFVSIRDKDKKITGSQKFTYDNRWVFNFVLVILFLFLIFYLSSIFRFRPIIHI